MWLHDWSAAAAFSAEAHQELRAQIAAALGLNTS